MNFFDDRGGHIPVDDLANDLGCLFDLHAERLCDFLADGLGSSVFVQPHPAAEVVIRIDVAEHDVGVRYSGLLATAIETHWSRHGTCAFRPDLQLVLQQLVDPGDGTATRADGQCLNHGDANHPTVDNWAEIVAAHAVLHYQSHIKARSSHVRHDHVAVAECLCDVVRAHQTGDRSAVERAAGGGAKYLRDAAGTLDHQQGLFVAALAKFVPHGGELNLHGALQIGVEDGSEGSFIFAKLADHLAREHNGQIANVKFLVLVANDLLHAFFMKRIEKAPEKRDHKTARAAIDEVTNLGTQVLFVERTNDGATRIDSFLDADNHVAGNQRIGLLLNGKIAALGDACAVNPLCSAAD